MNIGRTLVLASWTLILMACNGTDLGLPAAEDGSGGTAGGPGGGGGGSGGEAGKGIGGNGAGGTDGNWLLDDEVWRELPEVAGPLAEVRVWQGRRDKFQFPALTWESCGEACEQAVFDDSFTTTWSTSLGQVRTDRGPSVWLGFTQPLGGGEYRRIVDLSSGETVAALRMDHESGNLNRQEGKRSLLGISESATTIVAMSNELLVIGAFDPVAETWDFKLPWNRGEGFYPCPPFDLDTSPPTLLAGCGDTVRATLTPGAAQMTPISEGARFLDGAGHAGLAAWSEMYEREWPSHFSRVMTWSPATGVSTIIDRMYGAPCGIGVGQDRVVGFRSGEVQDHIGCWGPLVAPEFWSVSRSGGEVHTLPVALERFHVIRAVTWGDYAAAMIVKAPVEELENFHHYHSTLLIRLSDGAIRELPLDPLHSYRDGLVSFDDDHLYIGEAYHTGHDHVGRIQRFPLAEFEKLGRKPVDVSELLREGSSSR